MATVRLLVRFITSCRSNVGGTGEFLLNFTDYIQPNDEFQLIVKALIVQPQGDILRTPIVLFREFRDDAIVLNIIEGGSLMPANRLNESRVDG